jgi:hypothetical protein
MMTEHSGELFELFGAIAVFVGVAWWCMNRAGKLFKQRQKVIDDMAKRHGTVEQKAEWVH